MKFLRGKFKSVLVVGFLMLAAAAPASADIVFCGGDGEAQCTVTDLFYLIFTVVNYLIGAAGLVALIFIVFGGVQMLISAGSPDRVKTAKSTVYNALLGFVMVMISYLVVGYVAGLLLPGVGNDPLRRFFDFL